MKKTKELREMSDAELNALVVDSRKEIFHMRNAIAKRDKEGKPQNVWVLRKDIARAKTLLRERQMKGA